MAKVIVVGAGTIGLPLIEQLLKDGHTVVGAIARRRPENLKRVPWIPAPHGTPEHADIANKIGGHADGIDAAFLAIPTPTGDHGMTALRYMQFFADRGVPVITAEKGTSAYHFKDIAQYVQHRKVGCYATVGGGTLMIPKMQLHHLRGRKLSIHGVFNATLNYIFTGVIEGRSLQTVCEEAAQLGYAEPAEKIDPVTIVNGEINDVKLKICAFYNHVLAPLGGPFLIPDQFTESRKLDWPDLHMLTDYNRRSRFIVRLSNDGSHRDGHGGSGWLHAKLGAWDFDARFVELTRGSPLDDFLPKGVDNCIKIQDVETGNGPYRDMGPGAGKTPTVGALMTNFYDLCGYARAVRAAA